MSALPGTRENANYPRFPRARAIARATGDDHGNTQATLYPRRLDADNGSRGATRPAGTAARKTFLSEPALSGKIGSLFPGRARTMQGTVDRTGPREA
jgi:hypothetical protein